ncbi:hypothetical protein [Okeania sp. SIO1I7]|uniref:hypothetical protein n=1 Tax=Okeania sp. SIO1I7 TaxID=2607772 RepID=UPI0013FC7EF3|nr:hypothetical protein [Okeania sp. SIO1I7]NET28621.1 hypothetical protein [Okeania sp. SIO1I7]
MDISKLIENFSITLAGTVFLVLSGTTVQAATITNGFTFSVANDGVDQTLGHHFHSSTGGEFGNPAGKAEVGGFLSEEVRGLSEYDLTGLGTVTSAFVTFNVFNDAGLFLGYNDFPFTGDINIVAYEGNNSEDLSDYQALSIQTIDTFNTGSLSVGDTLSFDITSTFNNAVTNGLSSLGIRLESETDPQGGAWTFDTFRLTTDNQSSNISVPEPSAVLGLLAFGFGGLLQKVKKDKTPERNFRC